MIKKNCQQFEALTKTAIKTEWDDTNNFTQF